MGEKIISAGFALIDGANTKCYGLSESLSISSLPEDSQELKKQLGIKESQS